MAATTSSSTISDLLAADVCVSCRYRRPHGVRSAADGRRPARRPGRRPTPASGSRAARGRGPRWCASARPAAALLDGSAVTAGPATSACCSRTCPSSCSSSAAPRSAGATSSASTRPAGARSSRATSATPTAPLVAHRRRAAAAARRPRPRRGDRRVLDRRAARGRAGSIAHAEHAAAARAPRSPTTSSLLIFTSGSTGAPKAVQVDPGPRPRAASDAMALHVATTSSTARCRCSTATRSSRTSSPRSAPARRSRCARGSPRRRSSPTCARYGCTYFNTVGRALVVHPRHARAARRRATTTLKSCSARDVAAPTSPRSASGSACSSSRATARARARSSSRRRRACRRARSGAPAEGTTSSVLDPETGDECPRGALRRRRRAAQRRRGDRRDRRPRRARRGSRATTTTPRPTRERTRNGWYWSGDLGYRDDDGVFCFAGRTADWLRVDGENFAAAPVERILGRFPGVAAVAVYGVPDERSRRPGDGRARAATPARAFDPDAFDAFLAEQRRPRHEVGAALRARRRRAPGRRRRTRSTSAAPRRALGERRPGALAP